MDLERKAAEQANAQRLWAQEEDGAWGVFDEACGLYAAAMRQRGIPSLPVGCVKTNPHTYKKSWERLGAGWEANFVTEVKSPLQRPTFQPTFHPPVVVLKEGGVVIASHAYDPCGHSVGDCLVVGQYSVLGPLPAAAKTRLLEVVRERVQKGWRKWTEVAAGVEFYRPAGFVYLNAWQELVEEKFAVAIVNAESRK